MEPKQQIKKSKYSVNSTTDSERKTKSFQFQYAMIMNITVKPYDIYIYKIKHVHTVNWLTLLFSANPKNLFRT